MGLDRCLTVCARTHLPIHNHTTPLAIPIATLLFRPEIASLCNLLPHSHACTICIHRPSRVDLASARLPSALYLHAPVLASRLLLFAYYPPRRKDQRPKTERLGLWHRSLPAWGSAGIKGSSVQAPPPSPKGEPSECASCHYSSALNQKRFINRFSLCSFSPCHAAALHPCETPR